MMKRSLSDLIDLWLAEPSMRRSSKEKVKHIKRALKELLEHLGLQTLALKPTEYYEVLKGLELEELFQAVKSRLLVGEAAELQATSGLTAEFWINGIRELYNEAVASKNPETTKNRNVALVGFTCFLVQRPEWTLLSPLEIPLVRPPSHGKSLPRVYPEREFELYGLAQEEWPQQARDEVEKLKKFWSTGGEEAWEDLLEERYISEQPSGTRPEVSQAKPETIERLLKILCLWFGWQVRERNVPKEELTLQSLLNPMEVRRFNSWQRKRDRSHAIALHVLKIGIAFAKMENFAKSKRRKWQDVLEVLDLQDLQAELNKQYEIEKRKSTEEKKPMRNVSHPQLEQMRNRLLQRCAPFTQSTNSKTRKSTLKKRPKSAIVQDQLIHILCSIPIYLPVRQQQIRTAAEEESLLRRLNEGGQLTYILYSREHKLERHTGKPHVCTLPSKLVSTIDAWVKKFRPLAEQAVENPENWLDFWGHKPDELQKLEARLEAAREGCVPKNKEPQSYMQRLETRIRRLKRLINALSSARANLQSHNYCFFTLGVTRPESFGKPLSCDSLTGLVTRAMAEASRAVLGKVLRISPHVFRYIAALHIRRIRGDANLLSNAMNHSYAMSEEYAQMTSNPIDDAINAGEWWIPA